MVGSAANPLRFVRAIGPKPSNGNGRNGGDEVEPSEQAALRLTDVSQGVYAHAVAASGLGKPGMQV